MSELTFFSLGYAFEHLLASVLVALLVLVLLRVRAITAEARAGVLLLALMLSVAAPLVPLPQLGGQVGSATAGASAEADAGPPAVSSDDRGTAFRDVADTMPAATRGLIEISQPIAMLLVALWFAGAAVQLARHVRGDLRLRRVIAASRRSHALENDYRELLPRGVELHLSASFGPAVVGLVRPKILLPEQLAASLPEQALRAVLLHEASHVRRNDLLANAFQKIAEAVFWWNPVIRWMGTTLDAAREIACDVEASRSCETSADYADGLLTAVEHIAIPREARFASALSVTSSMQTLDQRIESIIEERGSGTAARFATMGAVLSLTAVCAVACAVSQPLMPVPAAGVADVASGAPIAAVAAEQSPIASRESLAHEPSTSSSAGVSAVAPVVSAVAPPVSAVTPAVSAVAQSVSAVAPTVSAVVPAVNAAELDTAKQEVATAERAEGLSAQSPDYSAAMQASHVEYTTAAEAKHRAYVQAAEAKHQKFTEAAEAEHRQYTQTANAKHRSYTESAEAKHREYTEAMEAKYRQSAAATGEERRELIAAMEKARLEYGATAERERLEYSTAAERERREYSAEAERKRREFKAAMEAERKEYDKAVTAEKAKYERQVQDLRARQEGALR